MADIQEGHTRAKCSGKRHKTRNLGLISSPKTLVMIANECCVTSQKSRDFNYTTTPIKRMLVVFCNTDDILLHKFIPQGHSTNQYFNSDATLHLWEVIKGKYYDKCYN